RLFRRPPSPPLFPYTTLFRSCRRRRGLREGGARLAKLELCARRQRPRPDGPREGGRRRAPAARLPRDARPPPPRARLGARRARRSEEHTSELQSRENLVCRLL